MKSLLFLPILVVALSAVGGGGGVFAQAGGPLSCVVSDKGTCTNGPQLQRNNMIEQANDNFALTHIALHMFYDLLCTHGFYQRTLDLGHEACHHALVISRCSVPRHMSNLGYYHRDTNLRTYDYCIELPATVSVFHQLGDYAVALYSELRERLSKDQPQATLGFVTSTSLTNGVTCRRYRFVVSAARYLVFNSRWLAIPHFQQLAMGTPIDVLFYNGPFAGPSRRQQLVLNTLHALGFRVESDPIESMSLTDRAQKLRNARVVISIGENEPDEPVPAHYVVPALANGGAVLVIEKPVRVDAAHTYINSLGSSQDAVAELTPYVTFVPYDGLVDEVQRLLAVPASELRAHADEVRTAFLKRTSEWLGIILEE